MSKLKVVDITDEIKGVAVVHLDGDVYNMPITSIEEQGSDLRVRFKLRVNRAYKVPEEGMYFELYDPIGRCFKSGWFKAGLVGAILDPRDLWQFTYDCTIRRLLHYRGVSVLRDPIDLMVPRYVT